MDWRRAKYPALVVALALLITFLPMARVIFYEDRALFFRDLGREFLVQKSLWADSVRAGEGIPLWNHFAFGGMRFWAQNVEAPLHPLNSIFLLFDSNNYARALVHFIWAHYLLLFLASYFLFRNLERGVRESLVFATSLALSGYAMSANNLLHILTSLPAVPAFFAFWLRWRKYKKPLDMYLASFALAWPVYGGDPIFSYYMGVVVLVRSLWELWCGDRKQRRSTLAGTFSLFALAFLAAAPQLLPTLESVRDSMRGLQAMDRVEILAFSFHPLRLFESAYPNFFGNLASVDGAYWGGWTVNFPFKTPFVFSTYPGALILFLASSSLGLTLVRVWERRWDEVNYFWLLTFLALFFCFGVYSPIPIYETFLSLVPFLGAFRYPERSLFLPFFLLIVVAGKYWWSLEKLRRQLGRSGEKLVFVGPALLVALSVLLFLSFQTKNMAMPQASEFAVLRTIILFTIYLLVFGLWWRGRISREFLLGFVLVINVLDLASAGRSLFWDQSKFQADRKRYPLAQEILADIEVRKAEIRGGAAWRMGTGDLPIRGFPGRMNRATQTSFAAFDNLLPNAPAYFGIPDINGYYAFTPFRVARLWGSLSREMGGDIDNSRIQDVMGAYYRPTLDERYIRGLNRNRSAVPYLGSPKRVHFFATEEEGLEALVRLEFLPLEEVAVVDATRAKSVMNQSSPGPALSIESIRHSRVSVVLEEVSANQILLWNSGYDRWWRAYANGKEVKTYLANTWSTAIDLGEHSGRVELELRYQNPLIFVGIILFILWFGLCFFHVVLVGRWKSWNQVPELR